MKDYSQSKSSNHILARVVFLALLLAGVIFGGGYIYINLKAHSGFTDFSREQVFDVTQGKSLREIAQDLEEQKLISSAFVFAIYARTQGVASAIQAGSFLLDSSMSMSEILDALAHGRGQANEIVVTLTEGSTVAEMALHLAKAELFSAEDFVSVAESFSSDEFGFLRQRPAGADLEGYLFPDTYNFKKDSSPEEVLQRILKNFEEKITPEILEDIAAQNKSLHDILILASIVEGEVGRNTTTLTQQDIDKLEEERRLVAGVFYNRLEVSHLLQSDATLGYATGESKRQLTQEDIENPSLYNTYQHLGLPPGPIGNPSLDAILAAIYPADTDFFYFLSKPDGEAVFARTLEEHNENKALYLR